MRACRLIVATAAVLVLAVGEARPVAPQAGAGDASARLLAFVDDFVSAKHLEQTNDLSAASFAKQLEETRGYLIRLRQIDRSKLSLDDVIDWRFAESILIGRELAQSRMQYWKKDPRIYMTFRWIGTAIGQPGDAAAKAEAVLRALRAVPVQLENGRKNLASVSTDPHLPKRARLWSDHCTS